MVRWLGAIGVVLAGAAAAQHYQPPSHLTGPPTILQKASPQEVQALADGGGQIEQGRPARWSLAEHRRLSSALAAIQAGRKGVVDAYVVAVALDSDPVFGREAREAARVLSRRYDAAGRTIVLAGSDGAAESAHPRGSPDNIAAALARVAEAMDTAEDVLILYTTSHGAPLGVVYNDGDQGYGALSPYRLWQMLGDLGIGNRMILVSACYSGVFVPLLQSPTSVIVTAASSERSSFGCVSDNDWTFFGDALINHALRKPQPLAAAVSEATGLVSGWEAGEALTPSEPQVSIGAHVARWLGPLEGRTPHIATAPVGRPAVAAIKSVPHRR